MTGIDITPRFIEPARERALRERVPAAFFVKDAREMAFDGEFDGAVCLCEGAFGLVGGLENHLKVLRGAYRAQTRRLVRADGHPRPGDDPGIEGFVRL
jgi:SAM-dependent methyltransferase